MFESAYVDKDGEGVGEQGGGHEVSIFWVFSLKFPKMVSDLSHSKYH
jgi:hypothetical protein